MPLPQLRRVRWAVRATLFLGVAASVVANILHALDNPISQAIAAWPPLALLLTVELISRVPVHRRSLAFTRLVATATIAGIAAWVSYWHMAGVAARYGETGASPYLLPLSVDGLIVVASICLVELGGRIAALTADQERSHSRTGAAAEVTGMARLAGAPNVPVATPGIDTASGHSAGSRAGAEHPAASTTPGPARSGAATPATAAAPAAAAPATAAAPAPGGPAAGASAAIDVATDEAEQASRPAATAGVAVEFSHATAESTPDAEPATPADESVNPNGNTPDRTSASATDTTAAKPARRSTADALAEAAEALPRAAEASFTPTATRGAGRPRIPAGTTATGPATRANKGGAASTRPGTRPRRSRQESVALAARIRAERPGVTDAELAAELGISVGRWRQIQRETAKDVETAKDDARRLGLAA
ncbi:DUF2637 domain-containing protein [Krasilnikovia sp. MM14-A1259]|uniref:DUF2637 domain-containing protein n=1 Tax=Krasilnikovia sp. MM14-A1259 TaxID=3373539 RepID=UPI0038188626